VARSGKITSLQITLPRGVSEPEALPKSGGFSGSPPPDPLREYVTLIMFACAVGAAQKLRAKTQATADRRVLEFTFALPLWVPVSRMRTYAGIQVKETGCKAFVNT
jgi:hypothetical protein